MRARFLIDAQRPPALARFLFERGHEAFHVADLGEVAASDRVIWKRAVALGAVLVTKDADFVTMRAVHRGPGPAVVWVRVGNATTRILIARFSAAMPALLAALQRGETVIQIG